MFYSFKMLFQVSYPLECRAATRQAIFDDFSQGYACYCAERSAIVDVKQAELLHFFKGDLPASPAFLQCNDTTEHERRVRVLVTYRLHFIEIEQRNVQAVVDHATECFKGIAAVFGGVMFEPDVTQGNKVFTNLF